MNSNFEKAVAVVLLHEGGYRNVPSDPGGPTKYGISQKSYPDLDIAGLTQEGAVALYRRDWWDKYGYDQISNYALALKVFDHAINIGWQTNPVASRAHVFLQMACNDVIFHNETVAKDASILPLPVDGILGPRTFLTLNALDPSLLLLRFLSRVHAHYKACAKTQPAELPDWEARLWGCL